MLSGFTRSPVFVDGFTFTTPKDHSAFVLTHIMSLLTEYGCRYNGDGGVLSPTMGLIRISKRHMVCSYHVNGMMCSYLRTLGIFEQFLGCIYALEEYRITRADLTVDVHCHAPAYLDCLDALLLNGGIVFPDGKHASHNGRPVEYTPEKERSGGLYFNSRKAERCGKIYDKAKERLDKAQTVIPPTTRIELTLSNKLGLSIVDLKNPAPLYYAHLPPAIMAKPDDVPDWEPWSDVAGFEVKPIRRTAGEKLTQILEAIQPQIEKASAIIEKESNHELHRYFMSRLAKMLGGEEYAQATWTT